MRRREFIKLLAGTAVGLPVAVRAQQLSIWTIESFNISREPCVDVHVDVCIDCAFFVASGVTAPEHMPEWSIAAITERWAREWSFVLRGEDDYGDPWSPCELCGSTRFGPRFLCTASYRDQSEAAGRGVRQPTAMPE